MFMLVVLPFLHISHAFKSRIIMGAFRDNSTWIFTLKQILQYSLRVSRPQYLTIWTIFIDHLCILKHFDPLMTNIILIEVFERSVILLWTDFNAIGVSDADFILLLFGFYFVFDLQFLQFIIRLPLLIIINLLWNPIFNNCIGHWFRQKGRFLLFTLVRHVSIHRHIFTVFNWGLNRSFNLTTCFGVDATKAAKILFVRSADGDWVSRVDRRLGYGFVSGIIWNLIHKQITELLRVH